MLRSFRPGWCGESREPSPISNQPNRRLRKRPRNLQAVSRVQATSRSENRRWRPRGVVKRSFRLRELRKRIVQRDFLMCIAVVAQVVANRFATELAQFCKNLGR